MSGNTKSFLTIIRPGDEVRTDDGRQGTVRGVSDDLFATVDLPCGGSLREMLCRLKRVR